MLPTLVQAVPLVARQRGTFERALAPQPVVWRIFHSGPELVGALFAGAIDVGYVGPGPAINGYLRSRGEALVVLAGAASGGTAFVVRAGIERVDELHGKTLASPQIGNTQDVALRTFLGANGLRTLEQRGDVRVLPVVSAEVLQLMQRGELDGAWVPEPWVTLLEQAGAHVLIDERSLWPGGRFPTALLVARPQHQGIAQVVAAHVDEVAWIQSHPADAHRWIRKALHDLGGKPMALEWVARAMGRIAVTWDPMPKVLLRLADQARQLGYLPPGDLSGLVDRSLLDHALTDRHLSAESAQ